MEPSIARSLTGYLHGELETPKYLSPWVPHEIHYEIPLKITMKSQWKSLWNHHEITIESLWNRQFRTWTASRLVQSMIASATSKNPGRKLPLGYRRASGSHWNSSKPIKKGRNQNKHQKVYMFLWEHMGSIFEFPLLKHGWKIPFYFSYRSSNWSSWCVFWLSYGFPSYRAPFS